MENAEYKSSEGYGENNFENRKHLFGYKPSLDEYDTYYNKNTESGRT